LILVNFFFWRPGSRIQNSVAGLRRCLLHDILEQCPDLVPLVFADLMDSISEDEVISENITISDDRVSKAFHVLLNTRTVHESHRLCFFIDALDEYQHTDQNDYQELMDMLNSWVNTSGGLLKLCVSSREHNVFENSLPSVNWIRLQELTRSDMLRYTQAKLSKLRSSVDRLRVANAIIDKSDGIFLWVTLVVKSLRERLEEGTNLPDFERHLDFLPTKLEELYDYLLRDIPPMRRRRAFQIFEMVSALALYEAKLPVISCSFMDAYDTNPNFALHHSPLTQSETAPPHYKNQDLKDWVTATKKMVQGCCRGLVEIREDDNIDTLSHPDIESLDACRACIVYVHRTIPEFLQRESTRASSRQVLSDFSVTDAVSQILLKTLQSLCKRRVSVRWASLNLAIVALRSKAHMDEKPYEFYSSLEVVAVEKVFHFEPPGYFEIGKLYSAIRPVLLLRTYAAPTSYRPPNPKPEKHSHYPVAHPLYLAAACGNVDYVAWKLATGAGPSLCQVNGTILLAGIFSSWTYPWVPLRDLPNVEAVLECINLVADDTRETFSDQLVAQLAHHAVELVPGELLYAVVKRLIGTALAHVIRKMPNRHIMSIVMHHKLSRATGQPDAVEYWMASTTTSQCFEGNARYTWSHPPYFRFITSHAVQPIPLRDLIDYAQFENESEIIQLLDELAADEDAVTTLPTAAGKIESTQLANDTQPQDEEQPLHETDAPGCTDDRPIDSDACEPTRRPQTRRAHASPLSQYAVFSITGKSSLSMQPLSTKAHVV